MQQRKPKGKLVVARSATGSGMWAQYHGVHAFGTRHTTSVGGGKKKGWNPRLARQIWTWPSQLHRRAARTVFPSFSSSQLAKPGHSLFFSDESHHGICPLLIRPDILVHVVFATFCWRTRVVMGMVGHIID